MSLRSGSHGWCGVRLGCRNHGSVFHCKNKTLKMEKMWRVEEGVLPLSLSVPQMGR